MRKIHMRCFLAIELDDSIKRKLSEAQDLFRGLEGKIALVPPAQMHLTLKFLGEVSDPQIPQIIEKLNEAARLISPFDIQICGLGAFPKPEAAKVLWVGIGKSDSLRTLFDNTEDELTKLGFPPEPRDFIPHLTIARIRGRINRFLCSQIIADNINFSAGLQCAKSIILFASELNPSGAVHTKLSTIPLAR